MHSISIVKHDLPTLEQINTDYGRFYKTPNGNYYPSVTSVLGSITNEYLDKWIRNVGKEEASRVSKIAANRGTKIHECCENYILGKQNKFSMFEPDIKIMFENLIPYIDQFEEVHGVESRVYSDILRVAGTIDCIAKIAGKMYIIDYKTSSRIKTREEIYSYFMQCSVYAIAFYELTGITIPNIRILMTVRDEKVLVFDEKVKDWFGKFKELRFNYGIEYKSML